MVLVDIRALEVTCKQSRVYSPNLSCAPAILMRPGRINAYIAFPQQMLNLQFTLDTFHLYEV